MRAALVDPSRTFAGSIRLGGREPRLPLGPGCTRALRGAAHDLTRFSDVEEERPLPLRDLEAARG